MRPLLGQRPRDSARRLFKRIEMVFDYAKATAGAAANPATWARVQAQASGAGANRPQGPSPGARLAGTPGLHGALRSAGEANSMAALALELMILTACSSGEVRGMLWTELSDDMATWTIPAERMKRDREHEVPLSADAVAFIKRLEPAHINKFVFPGRSNIRPIAHWAVWALSSA